MLLCIVTERHQNKNIMNNFSFNIGTVFTCKERPNLTFEIDSFENGCVWLFVEGSDESFMECWNEEEVKDLTRV